jgi:uncharacterized integral membrane protein
MEGAPAPSGRGARFWLTVAAAIVAIVFVAVNFQEVTVDFIVAETKAPLVIALLLAGLLGFIIGLALPRFRGRD